MRSHLGLNALFFASILLMMVIFVHFRGNDSGSFVSSAMGETLTNQITRDVRDAINTLHESVSLRDWVTSGYTPGDVFSNVKSFNNPDANLALCEVLQNLPPSELSLFLDALKEDSFEASTSHASLPCVSSLLNRIQDHWQDVSNHQQNTVASSVNVEVRKIPAGETSIDSTELNSGEFALVFEGAINAPQTTLTLKQLQKFDAKATFLIPGDSARNHSQVVKSLFQAGQSLGSQSTEEEDMALLPTEEGSKKLIQGEQSIASTSGHSSRLFSFPLSEEDVALSPLQDFTRSKGMVQIISNLDSEDWKTQDPKLLAKNVSTLTAKSSKGIILLHSRLDQTALALPEILKNLSMQHRKLVIFRQ